MARKKWVSKRVLTTSGVIQRENLTSSVAVGQRDAGLLVQLAHGGGAVRAVVLALGALDGAAREHPHPAHEARGGIALDEQQLQVALIAAQQDHGRGLAWRRRRPWVVLLARCGAILDGLRAHRSTLPAGLADR